MPTDAAPRRNRGVDPPTDNTNASQAPDVSKVGDYYYVYYSVSAFGVQNSAIGVARSSGMDVGSWTDLGSTGVASSTGMSYNAIDGNLINDNGNYFLTFGSFWNGIQRVRVTPTQKNGDVYQVAFDPNDTAMEGPFVFPYGGYYYLFFSKGQCCGYDTSKPAAGKEYRIMVCRSTSAVGPFVDQDGKSCRSGGGTKVLESHDWVYGPGGQGVYQDPTYGPVSPPLYRPDRIRLLMASTVTVPTPLFRLYTTTTSILASAMRMDRRSLVGIRSTSRAAGRWFKSCYETRSIRVCRRSLPGQTAQSQPHHPFPGDQEE